MRRVRIIIICILHLCLMRMLFAIEAGSAYVPVSDPVYGFLDNLAIRGLLPLKTCQVRPINRIDAARMLMLISRKHAELNDAVLSADLRYHIREFAEDIKRLKKSVTDDVSVRNVRFTKSHPSNEALNPNWHLLGIENDNFELTLDPVLRFRGDFNQDKTIIRRSSGVRLRGHYENFLGYYFRFIDSVERGNMPYNHRGRLLNETYGYVGPLTGGKETYYDVTEAYISMSWQRIEVVFGKDNLAWGSSRVAGLYLSDNAPSFNHFRFNIELLEKLRFTYFVGKLHPYKTPKDYLYTTTEGWDRKLLAPKWIASHRLEYAPFDWLVTGVGETVIWGERGLDMAYLNPLNFYYSAEHDGGDQDNALLWADISVRCMKRGVFYGELLIDDLKTSTIGKGDPGNKLAITAGLWATDIDIDGLSGGFEYTRIQPYVYSHFYPVNRYSNWTTSLGSDLAPNSDRFRLKVYYKPLRQLALTFIGDKIRHGDRGASLTEAIPKDSPKVYFLDDNVTSWTRKEISVSYEALTGFLITTGMIQDDEITFIPDRNYIEFSYRY